MLLGLLAVTIVVVNEAERYGVRSIKAGEVSVWSVVLLSARVKPPQGFSMEHRGRKDAECKESVDFHFLWPTAILIFHTTCNWSGKAIKKWQLETT